MDHQGKLSYFVVCESSIARPSVGTTVTVHELFMNFPVRQKSVNKTYELEKIRETLESIALIRPGVSLSLRNDTTANVILQTRKCSGTLAVFAQLYGTDKADMLSTVDFQNSSYKISGYIGRCGHSRKNLQFVYINHRLVKKSKIHKVLSQTLINLPSLKAKFKQTASPDLLMHNQSAFKTPPKFSETHPVYIMQVTCPLSEYDITFEPAKTLVEFKDLESLIRCVEKLAKEFVEKQQKELAVVSESPNSCKNIENITKQTENKTNVPENVISVENFTDVLLSKTAKRTKCPPPEPLPNVPSTPQNTSDIVCRAVIGLGARKLPGIADFEDINNTSYNHSDSAEDTEKEFDRDHLGNISMANSKKDLKTKNAMQPVKHTEPTSSASKDVCIDKPLSDVIQSNAKVEQKQLGSLSIYKQSIGKFSTKGASIDERLKKQSKTSGLGGSGRQRMFSSLQKFRRVETSQLPDIDLENVTIQGTKQEDDMLGSVRPAEEVYRNNNSCVDDTNREQTTRIITDCEPGTNQRQCEALIIGDKNEGMAHGLNLVNGNSKETSMFGNQQDENADFLKSEESSPEYRAYRLVPYDTEFTQEQSVCYDSTCGNGLYVDETIRNNTQTESYTSICDMEHKESASMDIPLSGPSRKRAYEHVYKEHATKEKMMKSCSVNEAECNDKADTDCDTSDKVCNKTVLIYKSSNKGCGEHSCDITDCDELQCAIDFNTKQTTDNCNADRQWSTKYTQNVSHSDSETFDAVDIVDLPTMFSSTGCSNKSGFDSNMCIVETKKKQNESNLPTYTTQPFSPDLKESRDNIQSSMPNISPQRTPESMGFSPMCNVSDIEITTPDRCLEFESTNNDKNVLDDTEKGVEAVDTAANCNPYETSNAKECNTSKLVEEISQTMTQSVGVKSVTLSQLFTSETQNSLDLNAEDYSDKESDHLEAHGKTRGFTFADIFDQTQDEILGSMPYKAEENVKVNNTEQINSSMFSEAEWERQVIETDTVFEQDDDIHKKHVAENVERCHIEMTVPLKSYSVNSMLAVPGTSKSGGVVGVLSDMKEQMDGSQSDEDLSEADNVKWRVSGNCWKICFVFSVKKCGKQF